MAAAVKVGSLAGAIASASYKLARNPASADKTLNLGSFFSGALSTSGATPAASAVATPLKEQEKPRNDAPRTTAVWFDPETLERGAKALWEINASNHAKKGTMQHNPKDYQIPYRTLQSRGHLFAGCGESFESPSELRAHTKVAHSFAFCETCGVSMLKSSLAAHRKKHESEQVLLRCPHPGCLHSYNKKSNLNAHIRAIHKNLRPYGCPHAGCEKLFAYKSVREKHAECSIHAERVVGVDFEAEDSEGRRRARGGRKRARLENVEDLLPREWRRQAPE